MKRYAKYGFFVCILGLAAALLPLSGCGGGGSDNTGSSNNAPTTPSSPDPTPTTPPGPGNALEAAQYEGVQGAIAKASQNSPKAGSVTQSSNAGSDGVTTDSVSVEARNVGGQVQYRVRNSRVRNSNAEWSVDSREDTVLARVGEEDWDGVELKKRLSGADLYVDVYAGPKPPSDHVAGGLWVYVPDSATNVDDFVFGAFADGNDPFEQSELSALTGVVTYEGEGDVTLVYSDADPAARQNYFPDASVTLRVDFDNETVSGTIRSFDADGEPVNLNMAELTLEEANIGDSDSGFFSGDTRGTTPKGVNGEGKWGGQFFGNGDGAPKGVAGTFGFTTSNGEESVLGVFGASRSEDTPSAPVPMGPADDCGVGAILSAGDSCSYRGGGSDFTITIQNDGSAIINGNIGSFQASNSRFVVGNVSIFGFQARVTNGQWEILALPSGAMPVSASADDPTPPLTMDDVITGDNDSLTVTFSCSGRRVFSSAIVEVTIDGTVRAKRSVSSLRLTGYVNDQRVGTDFLGSISAGDSKDFNISGTTILTTNENRCRVHVEGQIVG